MGRKIEHCRSLGEGRISLYDKSGWLQPSPSQATQLTAVPGEDTGGAVNSQTQHAHVLGAEIVKSWPVIGGPGCWSSLFPEPMPRYASVVFFCFVSCDDATEGDWLSLGLSRAIDGEVTVSKAEQVAVCWVSAAECVDWDIDNWGLWAADNVKSENRGESSVATLCDDRWRYSMDTSSSSANRSKDIWGGGGIYKGLLSPRGWGEQSKIGPTYISSIGLTYTGRPSIGIWRKPPYYYDTSIV